MKRLAFMLSVAPLALLAMPAAAQTAPASQKSTDKPAVEASAVDEVVVTGLRESLRSAQMIKRNFSKLRGRVFTRQISRADQKGKSLRPRVVWSFALSLDVEIAILHNSKRPSCSSPSPARRYS